MQDKYNVKIADGNISISDKGDNQLGYVGFTVDGNTLTLITTFVDPKARGLGIATLLMEEFYLYCKNNNYKAIMQCSYAIKWIEKNTTKSDIL